MAANNIYSHSGSGGSTPQSRASGAGFPGRATENVVGGTNLTPGQGVVWWINSPIHLNTLLSPQYSHVGIGNAYGFEQNFYALVAGSPSDVVAQAVPQVTDDNDQLLAPVAPIVLAEPREDGSIVHTVGSGQSFWVIAARYEVPLNQLYLFNNLNEGSVISPGDGANHSSGRWARTAADTDASAISYRARRRFLVDNCSLARSLGWRHLVAQQRQRKNGAARRGPGADRASGRGRAPANRYAAD